MRLGLLGLVVLLAALPLAFASSGSQRDRGAAVYAQSGCAHCHTIRAVGGNKGPDLSGVGRRLNEDQMRRQIVEGGKVMPAFAEILQEKELADLLAYLRSCRDKQK